MAPRKSDKSREQVSEYEDEITQPGSPDPMEKAKNILSKYNSSRDAKRKAVEEDYEKRAQDIGKRIDKLFNDKKSRVTKSQKALWDRLELLNQKRQSLENAILTSMKTVETHTFKISSELNAMFEGRIDELDEPSTQET